MNGKQGSLYTNHEALKFALSGAVDTIGLWAKILLIMAVPVLICLSGFVLIVGASGFFSLTMVSDMPFLDYLNPVLAKLSLRMIIVAVIAFIFFELFLSILQLGAAQIALDIHDRQTSSLGRLFCCVRLMFYQIIASFTYLLAVMLGLVFFIVPGLIVLVRLWPYRFVMVERQCGPFEALKVSAALTKGRTRQLLETFFLLIVIASLSVVSIPAASNMPATDAKAIGVKTIGLAIFIVYPMAELLFAFIYRRLAVRDGMVHQSASNQLSQ